MTKPKWTISKKFEFSASHCLDHLPEGHPCRNTHGHNYTVIVELSANNLNEKDMVKDYRDMAGIKTWLDNRFDHQHLNDVFPLPSTTESLAQYIYMECKKALGAVVSAVIVTETDKTTCRYEEIES